MTSPKGPKHTSNMKAAALNPYLTTPPCCPLTPMAQKNLSRVHVILIDSYPDLNLKFYKYVKPEIQVPQGSVVDAKPCNPHANYICATMLGVNSSNIPTFKGLKVTFIPAISCFGTAWDPNITKSLQAAAVIAQQNAAQGINTVISYSIGGTYNTPDKVNALKALVNIPRTYLLMSSGNDGQRNYCSLPTEAIPQVFVIGATSKGRQLSEYGDIGPCLKFYAPGRYVTPVNGKIIWGTSYSQPVVSHIFINMLLNNPDTSRDEIYSKVAALTDTVKAQTLGGDLININVFPKSKVCSTNPIVSKQPAPMVTQYKTTTSTPEVYEDLFHDPRSVPDLPISHATIPRKP